MSRELIDGLTDACGFVGGALGGLFLGRAFDFDVFAAGYGTNSMLGILLVQGHLHFLPTFSGIFGNVFTILLITLLTAYFPARRAARMSAAAALRHYE